MRNDTCLWKTPLALAAGLLCGAHAWAQCAGTAAVPGQAAAQIVALTGQGETRAAAAQPWAEAALAQRLAPGADLRTLALSSAALLLADRTQIRLAAQAQVRLCDSGPAASRLELAVGRLWARTKRSQADVQLQTPAALAAVRGTDWDVEVDASSRTTLTVLSGRIDVSNAQGRVELGPAEQATVVPGQAPVKRTLVQPRERVQWVMAPALVPSRWPELAEPGSPWRALALGALRAGRIASLREALASPLQAAKPDPLAVRLWAETEVLEGNLDGAQRRLHSLWVQQRDPAAAARRAVLLAALDRSDEARAFIDTARAQAPDAVPLLLADADAQRLAGDGNAALALYRSAVERAQAAQNLPQQAAARAGLGRALLERGDLAAARAALARAVQAQPDDPGYLAEAATAAAQALDHRNAHDGFAAALQHDGGDYVALAGEGLLALQQGYTERAREQLLKALVIEPRYAQAHVWLAVAEHRLGGQAAAFDSLVRARLADPKDPLPWQVESILRNDGGEPEAAIAAAREALGRLPYLKSLNPLASDAQGSANLGKALGDFGLEHWARAYAQESYYPLWAGSHFFMANRYESDFSRNSELIQGYLADPLAFGMGERQVPVLVSEGRETVAVASAGRTTQHASLAGDVVLRGLGVSGVPMAWLARVNGLRLWPRGGSGSYWLSAPMVDLAWGARPIDRLGLFVVHNQGRDRSGYPGGLNLGPARFDGVARGTSTRTDAGGSWRWSADAQSWFKIHHARNGNARGLDFDAWGAQDSRLQDTLDGVMLRHVVQWPSGRVGFGWEHARAQARNGLYDPGAPWEASERGTSARFSMPWLDGEWRQGPWSWQAGAYWPQLRVRDVNRYYSQTNGEDLLVPAITEGGYERRLRPRAGLSYRIGPGRALHAAYVENVHAPSTHTLAPVAVGAITIDHQYQRMGSLARKRALQLDWEIDARTFAWGMASSQHIVNPVFPSGELLIPGMGVAVSDRADVLAPVSASGQIAIDAYNGNPFFGQGSLQQVGAAWNRVLAPGRSLLASYTRARSRNTGAAFAGLPLPGVPRHTAVLAHAWRHGGRDLSLASMVYRGSRFADQSAQSPLEAGWNLNLVLFRESADRRWAWTGTLQTPLHGAVRPALWVSLRYRMD